MNDIITILKIKFESIKNDLINLPMTEDERFRKSEALVKINNAINELEGVQL